MPPTRPVPHKGPWALAMLAGVLLLYFGLLYGWLEVSQIRTNHEITLDPVTATITAQQAYPDGTYADSVRYTAGGEQCTDVHFNDTRHERQGDVGGTIQVTPVRSTPCLIDPTPYRSSVMRWVVIVSGGVSGAVLFGAAVRYRARMRRAGVWAIKWNGVAEPGPDGAPSRRRGSFVTFRSRAYSGVSLPHIPRVNFVMLIVVGGAFLLSGITFSVKAWHDPIEPRRVNAALQARALPATVTGHRTAYRGAVPDDLVSYVADGVHYDDVSLYIGDRDAPSDPVGSTVQVIPHRDPGFADRVVLRDVPTTSAYAYVTIVLYFVLGVGIVWYAFRYLRARKNDGSWNNPPSSDPGWAH